ncbi:uncharacterized protein SPPG_06805 [Spizellomyces punctatus DAOM BR117]|uniref:Selenoprotein O n=1 Tax=Spizellomyces punctatus (strain DAOM BR117) TaxID=645134 RepID=A0A0L0H8F7_SPIPD|nr:uncharacterized protein SPPG_06805 [Spizellomyces punctatus DAOM BR117]KNC97810.1 hypothetical protein SPPG_06805 [Spizellomyces punctatus DAOM BR117]|eukprot:XP_016605850.1 hypothetical protein SPPG_06805 [Spizellomyces punctatus DAOM BR117]
MASRPTTASARPISATSKKPGKHVEDLLVSDTFTRELPADPLTPLDGPALTQSSGDGTDQDGTHPSLRTPRPVRNAFFSFLRPVPCPDAILIAHSPPACQILDLDSEEVHRPQFTSYLTGTTLLPRAKPWAKNYGGHQFGIYAGQLGDGRCISLCEVVNAKKERWDIQIKGSGITPYSRFGDGCAVFRSCLREFLCSEYMAALGVPTTRALALFATKAPVYREDVEPGAMLVRLAPTWIRFGTFELFHYRNEKERVKELADFVVKHHFPDLESPVKDADMDDEAKTVSVTGYKHPPTQESLTTIDARTQTPSKPEGQIIEFELNKYARLFQRVIKRTAVLIAHWQAIGFVHGVLNTDNMSILGITLDYGPFGFLDAYDPYWSSNAADKQDRYRFEHQPKIAMWNLSKLGRTLAELMTLQNGAQGSLGSRKGPDEKQEFHVKGEEIVRELLKEFEPSFVQHYTDLMRKKLGFQSTQPTDLNALILPLLQLLSDAQADYTIFFRALCNFRCSDAGFASCTAWDPSHPINTKKATTDCLIHLLTSTERLHRLANQGLQSGTPAASVSDLDASMTGAFGTTDRKTEGQRKSTSAKQHMDEDEPPTLEEIATRWKDWATNYRSRLLSDAPKATPMTGKPLSADLEDIHRMNRMKKANPRYVLRGWIAEEVIDKVQKHVPVLDVPALPQGAKPVRPVPPKPIQTDDAFLEIERVLRVLVQDLWGDIADSNSGWRDDDDRNAAERWAGQVPEWALNLVQTTMS